MKASRLLLLAAMFCSGCKGILTPKIAADQAMQYGAGFVFICEDDDTVLLAHRSRHVKEPGVWTGLGGHVESGETAKEAAEREVQEEAGSMPKHYKIVGKMEYERNGMHYTTFIANVPKEEKQRWVPKRDFENDRIEWFRELPGDLHPGLSAALKEWKKDAH